MWNSYHGFTMSERVLVVLLIVTVGSIGTKGIQVQQSKYMYNHFKVKFCLRKKSCLCSFLHQRYHSLISLFLFFFFNIPNEYYSIMRSVYCVEFECHTRSIRNVLSLLGIQKRCHMFISFSSSMQFDKNVITVTDV